MKKITLIFFALISIQLNAQLTVADTLSNNDLIQTLAGPGLTISNVTVNCPQGAYGQFFGTNTNLGLAEGVLLTSGQITNAIGPNDDGGGGGTDNLAAGDTDLDVISTAATQDACVIEFDLETIGDSLVFNYTFASEEYLEFVNGNFNDVFAFFISGPGIVGDQNIALIPGTTTPIAIDNVNDVANSAFYINNGDGGNAPFNTDPQYIQFDGRTVTLQAVAAGLQPCQSYHLKLAIADAGDGSWDSGVFLEAGSFTSNAVLIASSSVVDPNYSFSVEGCVDGQFVFTLPQVQSTDFVVNYTLGGSATEGLDYGTLPDSLVIPAGDTTGTLTINVLADALSEGVEELVVYLLSPCSTVPYDSAILEIYDQDSYFLDIVVDDFTGCVASNATLTASVAGFSGHVWSPATGLNTTMGSSVVATQILSDITYTVSATLGTCTFTEDVFIDVNPLFSSISPQLDTSCTNGSVTLSAEHFPSGTNIVSYNWAPANLINDPTLQTVIAFPQATQDFYVAMTSDLGCTVTDTITVEVFDGGPLVAIEPMDTLVCPGQTVNLQATVYEECVLVLEEFDSFGDGWNGAVMDVIQNGQIVGSMTLEGGLSGSDTVRVLQGVSTQINFTTGGFPTETSYNLTYSGGAVIFSDGPSPGNGNVFTFTPNCGLPTPVYTYDWVSGGGLSSTSGANVDATPLTSSTYIVNAEGGSCTGTGFANIKVDVPAFEALGDTICIGEFAQLDVLQTEEIYNPCAYVLNLNSTFGWFGSSVNVLIDGILFGTFSEPNSISTDFDIPLVNGASIELVFNEPAFANGEIINLIAPDGTVVFNSNNPANGSLFVGTGSCTPTTEDGLSCSYTLDMQDSFGDGWNGANLTLTVNGVDVGTFEAAGNGTVANFELNPGDAFSLTYASGTFENEVTYSLFDPSSTLLFSDGPFPATGIVFSGTASNVGCTVIPADVTFAWTPAANLNDSTLPNPEANVGVTTEYYLSYTYGYSSCSFIDTTSVEVINPNIYTITNDTSTCPGENLQLNMTDFGANATYIWTPNTNINDNSIFNPIVNVNSPTTYYVTVDLGSCTIMDSVFIDIAPFNTVDLQPTDTAACINEVINLTANAGLTNYEWVLPDGSTSVGQNIAITEPGYYYFTFDGTNTCRGQSDSVLVTYIPYPTAVINNGINPVEKCSIDSILLFSDVTPSFNYQWLGNAQSGSSYLVFDPGTYILEVEATLGNITCPSTFSVDVENTLSPVIDLFGLEDILCCGADTILFDPFTLPNVSTTDSVFWNGVYTSDAIEITSPGSNTLEVVNQGGCNSVGTYDVEQYCSDPVIVVPADTLEVNQNGEMDVTITTNPGTITSYEWTPTNLFDVDDIQTPGFRSDVFGDNAISVEVVTTYTFVNADDKECLEIATESIFVTDEGSIEMPTAFSPNGDGVNDTFGPVITGNIGVRSFIVYNRWGEAVYRYNDNNPVWDGTFEALDQPADVYIYYISIELPDGTIQTYSGTVTLFY